MLSCKFCETLNNTFLTKHLRPALPIPKFRPTPLTPFFDPRRPHQNFMDPRYPRHQPQNLTHTTHALTLPMPPTNEPTPPARFSRLVWIYPKLRRVLNNRMTLNAIEIWNLNSFKGTHKCKNIKNQKQKKQREFFTSRVDGKKQDGFTRLFSWNAKRIFVSTNATWKNVTWKPVSND